MSKEEKLGFGGRTADSFFHHTNSDKLSFGQIVTITPNSICYEARLPSKTEGSAGSTAPPPPTQFGLTKISQIKHFYLQITHTYRRAYWELLDFRKLFTMNSLFEKTLKITLASEHTSQNTSFNHFLFSCILVITKTNNTLGASLVAQAIWNLLAVQETGVWSLGREDRWRREWPPTAVFLPGEFHGQGSLAGYSPWSLKELDTTEWLSFFNHTLAYERFALQFKFQTWDSQLSVEVITSLVSWHTGKPYSLTSGSEWVGWGGGRVVRELSRGDRLRALFWRAVSGQ